MTKAIGHCGAASLAELGELPADVALATSAQIKDLVDRDALPRQTVSALDALAAMTTTSTAADVMLLLNAVSQILAGSIDGKEGSARIGQ